MNKRPNVLLCLLLLAMILLASCRQRLDAVSTADAAVATAAMTATPVAAIPTAPTVATTSPTATATGPADEQSDVTAAPTEAAADATEVEVNGRNPDGTYFRGRADAPVVMIDYSDFF